MLITSEQKDTPPLLIIDKKGFVGRHLAEKLQHQFLVVYVSSVELDSLKNLVFIPYHKKIPIIPDQPYAPIFVVYNGEEEVLALLPSLVRKVTQTNSRVFFLTSLYHCTESLLKHLSKYDRVETLIMGEIFDESLSEKNPLTYFLQQVRLYGRIELSSTGLGKLHPVLLEDVVLATIGIAFAVEHRHRVHLVYPRHAFTEFTIARLLQKIDPEILLDFRRQKAVDAEYFFPREGLYAFHTYDLEDKLRTIDLTRKLPPKPLQPQKKMKPPRPKRRIKNPWTIFGLVLLVLILPALLTGSSVMVGTLALQKAGMDAESAHFDQARQATVFASGSFTAADMFSEGIAPMGAFAPEPHSIILKSIAAGKAASDTATELFGAATQLQRVFEGKSLDPESDFLHATATLKNSLLTLQKMKAEGYLPEDIQKKLSSMNEILMFTENTIDTWPSLLGFEGKKTYLVMFQNNMELRPGGGFIGSYGLLTLNKGRVESFKIHDVYDADGKLSKHVEPPFQLRRYLGSEHWFLRDSNFSLDFPRNGATAAQFLEMETGDRVDGVVAIDTSFLKNMLQAIGPVAVPDYKETVTSDNFYLMTQTHAEKDFFPGSTQKKDFLRALANAMLLKLSEGKDLSYRALAQQVGTSLLEKHVVFGFKDAGLQNVYTVNNLSAALWDGRKQETNGFLDYLGIIDANLGGNKANYSVRKSIDQTTQITTNGAVDTKVTVTYVNSNRKGSTFGGDYRNYVRFLLPSGASIQSVALDGQTVQTTQAISNPTEFTKKNFRPPEELEVEQTTQEGKVLVGMLVNVPTESTRSITITYTVNKAIDLDNSSFSYDLRLFKQAGTIADPYRITLSYPTNFTPLKLGREVLSLGGKLVSEGTLSSDKELSVSFAKK